MGFADRRLYRSHALKVRRFYRALPITVLGIRGIRVKSKCAT